RRQLLESRRYDDRLSGHGELGAFAVSGHDLARVDADAQREAGSTVLAIRRDIGTQRERRAHRSFGVVLVRDWNAEDGHDRVADELFDRGPVRDEDLARPG